MPTIEEPKVLLLSLMLPKAIVSIMLANGSTNSKKMLSPISVLCFWAISPISTTEMSNLKPSKILWKKTDWFTRKPQHFQARTWTRLFKAWCKVTVIKFRNLPQNPWARARAEDPIRCQTVPDSKASRVAKASCPS